MSRDMYGDAEDCMGEEHRCRKHYRLPMWDVLDAGERMIRG